MQLKRLPGVANVSMVRHVPREPEPLTEQVLAMVAELTALDPSTSASPRAFRIKVERKDKRYPVSSMELAALLGTADRTYLNVRPCVPIRTWR